MADYTNNSYDDNVEQLTEILRQKEGWGEGYDSSMGSMLIRLHADATDNLNYTLFRQTLERYMVTAKNRSSVVSLACELGYLAKRPIANYGTIRVTLTGLPSGQGSPEVIVVPANTQFEVDGVNVVTSEEVRFGIGDTYVDVPVKAGEFVTLTYPVLDFQETSTIVIDDYSSWDNNVLELSYGGTKIQNVRQTEDGLPSHLALSFAGPEDNYFDIRYVGSRMEIVLGDGTFGKLPDSDITLRYLNVDNDSNEVVSENVEAKGDLVLTGLDTNTEYAWEANSVGKISYGQDEESIESIKKNAMSYTRANGRAVTPDDTEFWIKESGIGNIVDVGCFGEQELKTFVVNSMNVYINYLTADGSDLSYDDEISLRQYLSKLLITGSHPVIQPVPQIGVGFEIDVVKPVGIQMANTEFYDIVKGVIEEEMKISNGSIGKVIEHSEIVSKLQSYQFTRNGITSNLVDYLKLSMYAYYQTPSVRKSFEHRISIDSERPLGTSGFISIELDGILYSGQYSNSHDNLRVLTTLEGAINTGGYFSAIMDFENEQLIVTSKIGSNFTAEMVGADPINDYFNINSRIDLPRTETEIGLTNSPGIYNGGDIELLRVDGFVVARYNYDANRFVSTFDNSDMGGSIDFNEGSVWLPDKVYIPLPPEPDSDIQPPDIVIPNPVIRYSHDRFGNIKSSKDSALVLKEFSDDYLTPNNFSFVNIGA